MYGIKPVPSPLIYWARLALLSLAMRLETRRPCLDGGALDRQGHLDTERG